MKKFIFTAMMLVASVFSTTANANDVMNLGIPASMEKICVLSENISKTSDTHNIYDINFNHEMDSIRAILGINKKQARALRRLQDEIRTDMDELATINDAFEYDLIYSGIISKWRKQSLDCFMKGVDTEDEAEIAAANHKYRVYWAIVNTTFYFNESNKQALA